jgi:hypothetical protein
VVFSENCEVANAIGAAASLVAHRVTVTVEGDGNGAFRVHSGKGTQIFGTGEDALSSAVASAQSQVESLALSAGAVAPRIRVSTKKYYLPDAMDDNGLLKAEIVAEASGRPLPV